MPSAHRTHAGCGRGGDGGSDHERFLALLDEVEDLIVPPDLAEALEERPRAQTNWDQFRHLPAAASLNGSSKQDDPKLEPREFSKPHISPPRTNAQPSGKG